MSDQTKIKMKTKHTPRPWVIDSSAYHAEGGNIVITETDSDGQMVALIYGETVEANEANARLIASAPELLEALRNTVFATSQKQLDDWNKIAVNLIAKIEGSQEG